MPLDVLFACLRIFPPSLCLRIYSFLWRIGTKWYGDTDFFVQHIPGNMYMKRGVKRRMPCASLASTLRYVLPGYEVELDIEMRMWD
jgi:hypothetical protein